MTISYDLGKKIKTSFVQKDQNFRLQPDSQRRTHQAHRIHSRWSRPRHWKVSGFQAFQWLCSFERDLGYKMAWLFCASNSAKENYSIFYDITYKCNNLFRETWRPNLSKKEDKDLMILLETLPIWNICIIQMNLNCLLHLTLEMLKRH